MDITTPGTLSLDELQHIVHEWITTHGVRYFSPLTNMAILAEETGEVARVIARIDGEQSAKPGETLDLADELADVIWVVAALANQHDINLREAVMNNLRKKTIRDKERHRNNPKLSDGRAPQH
ncbi:MAG: nucleotide pyrophosphohydrolase [Muribaculaceae bacterium]|nr:nucleotide pyrophosphohydrolase [Muribaculaceae bacterium]